MTPFRNLTSTLAPLDRSNIDTDQDYSEAVSKTH